MQYRARPSSIRKQHEGKPGAPLRIPVGRSCGLHPDMEKSAGSWSCAGHGDLPRTVPVTPAGRERGMKSPGHIEARFMACYGRYPCRTQKQVTVRSGIVRPVSGMAVPRPGIDRMSQPERSRSVIRGEEEWLRLVTEYEASGTTMTRFSAERGLARGSLSEWRKRFHDEAPAVGDGRAGGHHPTGRHAAAYCLSAPNAPVIS